jgi:lipoyl(octanoyl) transferase
MQLLQVSDLGTVDYQTAWDYQIELHKQLVDHKIQYRGIDNPPEGPAHKLLLVEHPHVFTLGKSGKEDHLLLDEAGLSAANASFYKINRGGDITYHGPGQLVVYAILDLDMIFTDVHRYVRTLEQAVIDTLAEYGVTGSRVNGCSGVWLTADAKPERKICAVGVHMSRWVTMHGLGFNINTDMNYFNFIVPCGISTVNKSVTSLAAELGQPVDLFLLKSRFVHHFCSLFQLNPIFQTETNTETSI